MTGGGVCLHSGSSTGMGAGLMLNVAPGKAKKPEDKAVLNELIPPLLFLALLMIEKQSPIGKEFISAVIKIEIICGRQKFPNNRGERDAVPVIKAATLLRKATSLRAFSYHHDYQYLPTKSNVKLGMLQTSQNAKMEGTSLEFRDHVQASNKY